MAVLTELQQTGRVAVETLSQQLDVSVVTIRRDLDALEQKGLLRRTHGGAVSISPFLRAISPRPMSWRRSSEQPTKNDASGGPPRLSSIPGRRSR